MSGNEPPFGGPLDKQWYVLKGRDVLGPFTGHVVNSMVRDGTIGPDARVAPVGGSEWQPLGILASQAQSGNAAPGPVHPVATGQRKYAGFWMRVASYILDAIIINAGVVPIIFVVALVSGGGFVEAQNNILVNIFSMIVWTVYYTLFTGGRWQATPGKRICNIHVVQETGAPVGYGRALGRFAFYFVDSIILCIGFMMAGWTREKTALHDLVCGTRVLYGRPQPRTQQVAGSF